MFALKLNWLRQIASSLQIYFHVLTFLIQPDKFYNSSDSYLNLHDSHSAFLPQREGKSLCKLADIANKTFNQLITANLNLPTQSQEKEFFCHLLKGVVLK